VKFPATGLYAITQTDEKTNATIVEEVSSAIKGGACVVQHRNKQSTTPTAKEDLARQLLVICQTNKIPFIINDDAELARDIGADGVHIGKHDGEIIACRKLLGPKSIIGVSCYDDINAAVNAQAQGADYVAFGRFFTSSSKPLASPAHTKTLVQAKNQIKLPIVAIGGILPENGAQLLDVGADILAVIGGLFENDPETSAQAYLKLFNL
jgi:thiamine-phosphate pyrophosphorylase